MTHGKLILLCILPLTQLVAFGDLIIKAINMSITISFDNFTEPLLEGFSMASVFFYTGIVVLCLFLLFIYLIPLKLAIDEENPLRWYYPCVCGCLRKRRTNMNFVDDENDIELETPLLGKGLGG